MYMYTNMLEHTNGNEYQYMYLIFLESGKGGRN